MTLEQIEAAALKLSAEERARLVDALIASLDDDEVISEEGRSEIARRVEETEANPDEGIPGEQVLADIRAHLAEMRLRRKIIGERADATPARDR
jgi:putative addiction module component (TIGR02574 family)